MIDVVFWDLGGVFTASPVSGMAQFAETIGIETPELWDVVFGAYHHNNDHPWHRLERGEATLADTMAAITANAAGRGLDLDTASIFAAMGSAADGERRRERSLRTLNVLTERGIRHGMITNNIKEFADRWTTLIDVGLFETIVDSSAVGLRKPDAAIYLLAMERLGVADPGRAAFVDDMASNVAAAVELGMHGVIAGDDIDIAMAELESLVG